MAKLFPTVSWAKGSNVYEVNIRQYTTEGTFAAFQKYLPRLQEMGVEILWFMPVTPISLEKRQGTLGSYYACSSYTAINPEFGAMYDLKNLVNDIHARGMKVIIDWVANHTGWDHHWTIEHPDWYQRNEHGEFYDKNGWADVIDLDYSNTAMRQEMIRCMQYWISEYDIDGFRSDMAHLVPLDFWMEARSSCDEIKSLFWLAETDNSKYYDVFDSTYAWSWMHKSEQFFRGHAPFHELLHETKRLLELPDDCYKLLFTTNHDENSWNGTEYEKYGNATKALAVFCCTFPGIPLVYSGQELPNNKRLKFFDKDEIEWKEDTALHSFYRSLLLLKKNSVAIQQGETEMIDHHNENIISFIRRFNDNVVVVILNLSAVEKLKFRLDHHLLKGTFTSLFSGLRYSFESTTEFEIEPWGYLVYYC